MANAPDEFISLADRDHDFARVLIGLTVDDMRMLCKSDMGDAIKREKGSRLVDKIALKSGINAENVIQSIDDLDRRIKEGEFDLEERDSKIDFLVNETVQGKLLEVLPILVPKMIHIAPDRVLRDFLLDAAAKQPKTFTRVLGFFGAPDEEVELERIAAFQDFVDRNMAQIVPLFDFEESLNHLTPHLKDFFAVMKNLYKFKRRILKLEEDAEVLTEEGMAKYSEDLNTLEQKMDAAKDILRKSERRLLNEFERVVVGLKAVRDLEDKGLDLYFGHGATRLSVWDKFFTDLSDNLDHAFKDMQRRVELTQSAGGILVRFSRGGGGKKKKFLIHFTINSILHHVRSFGDEGELIPPPERPLLNVLSDLSRQDLPQELLQALAQVEYKSPADMQRRIAKLICLSPEAGEYFKLKDNLKDRSKGMDSKELLEDEGYRSMERKVAARKRALMDMARTMDFVMYARNKLFLDAVQSALGDNTLERIKHMQEETESGHVFYMEAAEELTQRIFMHKIRAMKERDLIEDEPIVTKINELVKKREDASDKADLHTKQIDQFSVINILDEAGKRTHVEVEIDMLIVLMLLWHAPKTFHGAGHVRDQMREDDIARKRVGFIMSLIIRKIFKYISPRDWDESVDLFTKNGLRLLKSREMQKAGALEMTDQLKEAEKKMRLDMENFVGKLNIIRDVLIAANLVENYGSGNIDRVFKLMPSQSKRHHNAQFFEKYLGFASRAGTGIKEEMGLASDVDLNVPDMVRELKKVGVRVSLELTE